MSAGEQAAPPRLLERDALHSFQAVEPRVPQGGRDGGSAVNAAVKVLLVGDFPPPHGGVAVHVEELQRAVRAAGGEAVVLDIGKGQLPAQGVLPGASYPRFLAGLLSHAARGFLIHLHTSGANPKSWMLASACAAVGRATGRPALLTLHSGLGPSYLSESPLRRAVAGQVAGMFGHVVVVSHEIARMLRLCGVHTARLSVLPAFSRAPLEAGAPPLELADIRRTAEPLLCAMLAPGKVYGAEILLRAFARVRESLPRARLVLYGAGTASRELAALAEQLCGPSASAVHGLGELARPSALALIAASDAFVRPTLADGDSVSVREALGLGRRVVATSVGTRPAGVHLVPPGDDVQLARGIIEALGQEPPRDPDSGVDAFARLLSLYRTAHTPEGAPMEDRCAASAAS